MITASDVRSRFEYSSQKEATITGLIPSVIELFETLTGIKWTSVSGQVDVIENLLQTDSLYLDRAIVSSVSLVEVSDDGSSWSTVADTAYALLPRRRLIKLSGEWDRFIRVTYSGGYTTTTCPESVKAAIAVQVFFTFKRLSDNHISVSSQNFEGGSGVLLQPDLHPVFRMAVQSNRVVSV